jgi:predicted flap endonuclease-1-like 5' DNA nuclease
LTEEDAGEAIPENPIEIESAGDDLKVISGIGPTYERRLKEAGIRSYAGIAHESPQRLRKITGLKSWQAADPEEWIAEAQNLLEA